jgi:vitamin B12 transporter
MNRRRDALPLAFEGAADMILRLTLLGASALAFNFSVAWAEEARLLDPVEVTGLRPVEADKATVSVSVLTQDILVVRASPNPADQLRGVPGAAVSRSGSLGGLTQVRFRGAEANHTLVLFEGIEISDPVNGATDFGLLTALPVGRIEVLRGAASSVHGSDAISGEHLAAAVSGLTTDGVDAAGAGGEKDGSEALSGTVTGRFDLGADWSLSWVGLARKADSEFDSDTDFDGLLNDVGRRTQAEQRLVGAALAGTLGPLDHLVRVSFNEVDRDNFADGVITDVAKGQRTKVSWSPSYTAGAQTVTGLVDFERETYERSDVQFGGATDADEAFESVSFAGEYRLAAGAFDLAASVRHDDNKNRFDDATTWRLGAGYALESVGGRVRASIGTGIKNPTFTELYGFFTGSFIGNPDLKPEESQSWEIGWEQALGSASYSATYFDANLKNEIYTAFNPDFTSTALNRVGESKRSGVELAGRWQALANLSISGQATLFDSQDDTGADEIRVPEMTASLSADWQVQPGGLRLGFALDHVGEQGDFDFGPFPPRLVALEAYTLASLTVEYPLTERLALTLRGENLLGEAATDVFGYNGPGAGVFLGLKLR